MNDYDHANALAEAAYRAAYAATGDYDQACAAADDTYQAACEEPSAELLPWWAYWPVAACVGAAIGGMIVGMVIRWSPV